MSGLRLSRRFHFQLLIRFNFDPDDIGAAYADLGSVNGATPVVEAAVAEPKRIGNNILSVEYVNTPPAPPTNELHYVLPIPGARITELREAFSDFKDTITGVRTSEAIPRRPILARAHCSHSRAEQGLYYLQQHGGRRASKGNYERQEHHQRQGYLDFPHSQAKYPTFCVVSSCYLMLSGNRAPYSFASSDNSIARYCESWELLGISQKCNHSQNACLFLS